VLLLGFKMHFLTYSEAELTIQIPEQIEEQVFYYDVQLAVSEHCFQKVFAKLKIFSDPPNFENFSGRDNVSGGYFYAGLSPRAEHWPPAANFEGVRVHP
jgi:hypothetical protein